MPAARPGRALARARVLSLDRHRDAMKAAGIELDAAAAKLDDGRKEREQVHSGPRHHGRRVASTPGREDVPLSRTLRSAARPRRHARQPGETGGEEKQRGGFGDRRPVAILDDRLPPERIAESESARAVREIVPRSVGA